MSLIFWWYFDLGGVMPGGQSEIGGCGLYSGGFEQLLYDGITFWLGQCPSDNRVMLRDSHINSSDDNG